jgi:molybdopterin-containing oxidoreductase family membrane subunit
MSYIKIDSSNLGAEEKLVAPIEKTKREFWIVVSVLSVFALSGFLAWMVQIKKGLGVTGLNQPVYWGFYIINFVFFIGISHAGTLISAILRATKAEWRRTITRSAEMITVLVLIIGGIQPIIDLGRPDRVINVLYHPHFRSPLLWDVVSITTYLIGSTTYLYLPLIPDIAILRDRGTKPNWLYKILALGWKGTERQWKILNRLISIMMVVIIPIAVSVHTVVSWVFAMTVQPFWHSTIFGPFFVAGAIFSGIAALIIAMALIRKIYGLEDYFKPVHFNNLGLLLLVMALIWAYFIIAEHLTSYYGAEPTEIRILYEKLFGRYKLAFWGMVLTNFIIPVPILAFKKTRTVLGTTIASISILIGMWLERFQIVIPTLTNPRLPYERGIYFPSITEWLIFIGCGSFFLLLYILFTKFFPIVSIWEIKEGKELGIKETEERVKSYY